MSFHSCVYASEKDLSEVASSLSDKSGWHDNYYYKSGQPLKGIHKLDSYYYFFDKTTGEYSGEKGKSLYLGCFFSSMYGAEDWDKYTNNHIQPVMYLTVDGVHMHYFDNLEETLNAGYKSIYFSNKTKKYNDYTYIYKTLRDPAPVIHNKRLYLTGTSYGENRDYPILETNDMLSWDWAATANVYTDGHKTVWAPRWFTDDKGTHWNIFCGYETFDHSMESGKSRLYITQVDLSRKKNESVFFNTQPVPIELNGINEHIKPYMYRIIGGDVFKNNDGNYYMVVKRERNVYEGIVIPAALMLFKCTDTATFKSWDYVKEIEFKKSDGRNFQYMVEGASVIKVDDTYYLYGDTYEAVSTDQNGNKSGGYHGIYAFTSKDPVNDAWVEKLSISESLLPDDKGGMEYLRHGNFTLVPDDADFILKTYNGITEIPSGNINLYDGKTKYFINDFSKSYNNKLIGMPYTEQVSGNSAGLFPGTYAVTVKPKAGMKWPDGTTDNKKILWSIYPKKFKLFIDQMKDCLNYFRKIFF